jgi:hypothetical protein
VVGAGDILVGADSVHGHLICLGSDPIARRKGHTDMNIFYIIGVVVVVIFIAGYFGLR